MTRARITVSDAPVWADTKTTVRAAISWLAAAGGRLSCLEAFAAARAVVRAALEGAIGAAEAICTFAYAIEACSLSGAVGGARAKRAVKVSPPWNARALTLVARAMT